jgi:hypothetical protein
MRIHVNTVDARAPKASIILISRGREAFFQGEK